MITGIAQGRGIVGMLRARVAKERLGPIAIGG
jgi:hypothetical protein